MRLARTRNELAAARAGLDGRVALVPTMGNLHAGHLALIDAAHEHADHVVASVFVNPLQFGPSEDFGRYPRTPNEDRASLAEAGVALLFTPSTAEMYPDGVDGARRIEVPASLGGILDGATRPGHFDGVATVVRLLFDLVEPDVAVFGEKDFQQLLVIRWLVHNFRLPIEIIGLPTVREPDGLALSSRNQYLSADERAQAPAIFTALTAIAGAIREGHHDWDHLETHGRNALTGAGLRPDYFEIRNADDLSAPIAGDPLVILTAAHLGETRLIDNLRV
ncbi:MAG: pantoate--beta-alanine ligase [Gammaproteobacteria bacterium]